MTETRDQSIKLRRRILDDAKRRRELEKLAAIAFPKEAADAMRQMGRILGEGRDSERRRRLMDSIEGFIKRGEWPLLELADIPLLWYPNDPEKQSALLAKMKAAFEAGELLPMVAQGFTSTHLCNWKDAPPIPINSPMLHFLPAWMEREGQREPQAPESAARVGAATPADIAKRQAELKRARVHGYTKQTAEEFGCSTRWVTECARREKLKPPSGAAEMVKQLTPGTKKRAGK
jgi:hypothetical protein